VAQRWKWLVVDEMQDPSQAHVCSFARRRSNLAGFHAFASRSRRRSSSLLTGRLGGGMTHPLIGAGTRCSPAKPPASRSHAERPERRTSQPATLAPTRPALVLVPTLATTHPMDLDLRRHPQQLPVLENLIRRRQERLLIAAPSARAR
jgi:hypothetical protein